MTITSLLAEDVNWAIHRMPKNIRELLKENPGQVFVAGGYLRSTISNEPVQDIDLFAPSKEVAEAMAKSLDTPIHTTENALTLWKLKPPVQFITRWTFPNPEACLESFDFTIAQAGLWYDGEAKKWVGKCSDRFYADLAAKRLIYLSPEREEEAGGSLLRVLKFYQRGFRIPQGSLGAVIGRLLAGVDEVNWDKRLTMDKAQWERLMGHVLTDLLVEVDPLIDAHVLDAENNQQD